MEFTLVQSETTNSFSLPAELSNTTQHALDEIYDAAGWGADLNDFPEESAQSCRDRILSKIVAHFSIGKKALFEYWHVLKDKGIEASDVYHHTTSAHRVLLDNGEYDQYVEQIRAIVSEKEKQNCVIS